MANGLPAAETGAVPTAARTAMTATAQAPTDRTARDLRDRWNLCIATFPVADPVPIRRLRATRWLRSLSHPEVSVPLPEVAVSLPEVGR